MQYRPEIDGLRALAVLPVLFFHAGFSGFSGGFVGVDIFFVISGFLITGILIHDNENKKYSIVNFYERRARRLIPVFLFVLSITLLFSLFILPPEALHTFGKSLVASVGIVANVFFQNELDYFSMTAEEMPLLHIWSLSVEEQYYVIFPLALSLAYFLSGRRLAYIGCLMAIIASYAYMSRASYMGYDNVAFYSIVSRAWELGAGGLLAFHMQSIPKNKVLQEIGGTTGFLMILISITTLNAAGWPNHSTLLPVIGTVLILAFATDKTLVGRLLTIKPIMFIGLISYSLYLWHQPIYALSRTASVGPPSFTHFVLLTILSVGLAYLTYRFIETPFRDKAKFSRKYIFTFSLTGMFILGLAGLFIHINKGFPDRYSEPPIVMLEQVDRKCITKGNDYLKPGDAICHRNPESPIKIAVLGDSHSNEIAISLAGALPNQGLVQLSFSGCAPAYTFQVQNPGCHDWTQEAVQYVIESQDINTVVIAYRHSMHLFGEHAHSYPNVPNDPKKGNVLLEYLSETHQSLYVKSFQAIIKALSDAGKNVILIGPYPELPGDIRRLVFPTSVLSTQPRIDLTNSISMGYYYLRNQWWWDLANNDTFKPAVVIAPHVFLCSESSCPASIKGVAAYYDDDHLTPPAVKLFLGEIIKKTKEFNGE